MTTRMLGALALCAVVATTVNTAAHAGFLKNSVNLAKATVQYDKNIITNSFLTRKEKIRLLKENNTPDRCWLRTLTTKPCY